MNFASRPAGLQAIMSILRGAFLFRMKIRFTSFFAFRMTTESITLLLGLLRWCSNQSPGPEAVP
jgi:hypothetical protein